VSANVRIAGVPDLDGVMAIETAAFRNDAWSVDAMRSDLGSNHTHYLVVEDAGHIVAYAGLLAPPGASQADIQTIAVAESARRQGWGRVLMTALIAEAKNRGAREVFLDVRADNPNAQALYESLGFEEIGIRQGYYQPDNVDATVMRLGIAAPSPAVGA
jgi:[ribosomal protein S18]-alanine N-acetyltransferase